MLNSRFGLSQLRSVVLTTIFATLGLLMPTGVHAQLTKTPASASLGSVAQGEPSALLPVTLKNTGAATITLNSFTPSPGIYFVDPSSSCTAGMHLAHNATCLLQVGVNAPVTLGALPAGTVTVASTAPNPSLAIPVSGTVVLPVTLTASVNVGNSLVGFSVLSTTPVVLKNNQAVPLVFTTGIFGPFAEAGGPGSCFSPLAPKSSCNL